MVMNAPQRYDEYYFDEVDGFRLVWQPFSVVGLVVLNPESAFLFDLVDGNKSFTEILGLCQKNDKAITQKTVMRILRDLESAQIIYWKQPRRVKIDVQHPKTLGIWMHTTNQCNLRCEYCYIHKTTANMNLERGKQILSKILVNAKEHQFEIVKFKYSGGEVLLRFDEAMELVRFGKDKSQEIGIESQHVFLTNAVLMTLKKAKAIKEAGVRVMVSLDGPEVYHDQVRVFPSGKGSFQYVWRGITYLQLAQVPFNVSITVTEKNVDGIPELVQRLLEEKIPFVFNFFRENCEAGSDLMTVNEHLVSKMKEVYNIIEDNLPPYSMISGLLDRVSFGFPHLNACGVGRNYLVINQKGDLASCQLEINRKIGSIDDSDPIQAMIDGNFMRPKGLTVDQKKPCNVCLWRYVCGGGCPLLTNSIKGRYDLSSPYCEVYRALIPDLLRLEAKRLIRYKF